MKLPDPEQFNLKDVTIAGDECILITPKHMATSWDDTNARFRSCIVRKSDNYVVSQGFLKFTNFGERPDFQPWDNSWKFTATMKIDGTLLIISKYKGELITRTRGTTDIRQMTNGHEIDILMKKYPKVFDNAFVNSGNFTVLCEFTTPSNIIVLREHDEPTLTLVGMVEYGSSRCDNRSKYFYWTQVSLDQLGELWEVNRPEKYHYNTIEECILDVAAWTGKEGVVLYSPDGQTLKKIKSSEYCELHKLATGIKGIKQVLDVFMASPRFVEEKEFYNYISTTLDFEIAEKCKDFIGQITEAYGKFLHTYNIIQIEVDRFIKPLETRKEQAIAITTKFKGWQTPLAFCLLDNKDIEEKLQRIAMEQLLDL
jgi:hypothetical protein